MSMNMNMYKVEGSAVKKNECYESRRRQLHVVTQAETQRVRYSDRIKPRAFYVDPEPEELLSCGGVSVAESVQDHLFGYKAIGVAGIALFLIPFLGLIL